MIDTDEPIVTRPKKEPAKRWRAVWFTSEAVWIEDGGEQLQVQPGRYVGRSVFPSADLAETVSRAGEAYSDALWRLFNNRACPLRFDRVVEAEA